METVGGKSKQKKEKEMFYSGSESRTHHEKHLGLGLYVAERILELHHLKLLIENTKAGVKVTIKKYS